VADGKQIHDSLAGSRVEFPSLIGISNNQRVSTFRTKTATDAHSQILLLWRPPAQIGPLPICGNGSADILNFAASTSSVSKGETLLDTARNLESMAPDIIVIRHASAGAPHLLGRECKSSARRAMGAMHSR
jgi:hypothetical protein